MNSDIRTQYNNFSQEFSKNQRDKHQINRDVMHDFVGDNLQGKQVLDLACGDGTDAAYYQSLGASVVGVDASKEMISLATQHYPQVEFTEALAESLPFKDGYFDCIFTKYAIMTSADMRPIFDEVYRTLKPGGVFIYLVTHPFRQFIERKDMSQNYFKQTKVQSVILDATVTVTEPTHTMNEYFNQDFFSKYMMVDFKECHDPAAEQINGGAYPGFFIVKALKK